MFRRYLCELFNEQVYGGDMSIDREAETESEFGVVFKLKLDHAGPLPSRLLCRVWWEDCRHRSKSIR